MNKFIKTILFLLFFLILAEVFMSYYIGYKEGLKLNEISPFYLYKELYREIIHRPPDDCTYPTISKPVIYLYPAEKQKTLVRLDFNGDIIYDYPDYNEKIKGWNVIAYPDGRLINIEDNKEYSYIFWEGTTNKINYDLTSGFVVKGEDTKIFLQDTLSKIGLTPKEYNEFIVYWYPLMKDNKYNLIHFLGNEYTDVAKLTITPKPDSILRVFMIYKSLNNPIDIKAQEIKQFERKGFTVIEWGGSEIK